MFELSIFLKDQLVGRSTYSLEEVRIGRTPDNEVQIDNLALSRYHASIEAIGGAHVLKDFGSQNGTYVNGERVTGRRALDDGDRINVGKFTIIFRGEKQQTATAKVSDEASYAVAGETIVTRGPEIVRERPCPWSAYLEGPRKGKEPPPIYPLARDFFVIGASPTCQLPIADKTCPPRAAMIVRAWGGFSIVALAPGVSRNRAPLDLQAELKNADELAFGQVVYRFRVGRPDAGP